MMERKLKYSDIDNIPIGRELDSILGKILFGWDIIWEDPTGFGFEENIGPCFRDVYDELGERMYIPCLSLDLNDAFTIIEQMAKRPEQFRPQITYINNEYIVSFVDHNNRYESYISKILSNAIAKAALKILLLE